MQTSEWISLSLAIVTSIGVIIALFFGIRSIRESRNLQIIRYKSELIDKISNWIANVQSCITEDYLTDDYYSFRKAAPYSINAKTAINLNLHRRSNTFGKVLEEGRNILGIAIFFNKSLYEAVRSLEEILQRITELLLKYTKLTDDTSNDDELAKVLTDLDKEYMDSLKSIHESTAKLVFEIFQTRISLFDSISFGSDPFKDVG